MKPGTDVKEVLRNRPTVDQLAAVGLRNYETELMEIQMQHDQNLADGRGIWEYLSQRFAMCTEPPTFILMNHDNYRKVYTFAKPYLPGDFMFNGVNIFVISSLADDDIRMCRECETVSHVKG